MNDAHLHLILNHLPIVGLIFTVLVLGYGVVRKNSAIVGLGYMLLVLCAGLSMAANMTGEGAEHWVEDYTQASHHAIHEHEEAAELANILALALGVIALAALLVKQVKNFAYTSLIILIFAMGVTGAMINVGNKGGEIIHTEMHAGEDGVGPTDIHKEGSHDDD